MYNSDLVVIIIVTTAPRSARRGPLNLMISAAISSLNISLEPRRLFLFKVFEQFFPLERCE